MAIVEQARLKFLDEMGRGVGARTGIEQARARPSRTCGEAGERAGVRKAEWAAGMRGWGGWAGMAVGGESAGRLDSGDSGVEVVGQGLVELEFRSASAGGTHERQHVVDAGEQDGPAASRGGGGSRGGVRG